jgi:hypothetical protein
MISCSTDFHIDFARNCPSKCFNIERRKKADSHRPTTDGGETTSSKSVPMTIIISRAIAACAQQPSNNFLLQELVLKFPPTREQHRVFEPPGQFSATSKSPASLNIVEPSSTTDSDQVPIEQHDDSKPPRREITREEPPREDKRKYGQLPDYALAVEPRSIQEMAANPDLTFFNCWDDMAEEYIEILLY